MKSDLQISQAKKLRDIQSIAKKINLKSTDLMTFGKHIAKINSIPKRKKCKTYSNYRHEPNSSRGGKNYYYCWPNRCSQKNRKKNQLHV
jgi:hypothetical protein